MLSWFKPRSEEPPNRPPVAVIGMACRFPGGAHDPQAFWRSLMDGVDGTVDVPADRFDADRFCHPEGLGHRSITRRGGFLTGVDLEGFDTGFFRMSPREAADLDPQQRLLLEVSAEALEDAGIPLDRTEGLDAGVYVGISSNDYSGAHYFSGDLARLSTYSMLGTMMNTASGRIAYVFGLNGPVLSVDTACSASLTSLHLAVQAIRDGECALALAGGVNVLLNPVPFAYLSLIGALSGEGRCRSFDARASGYARAEGCGMVVLKALDAARRDGDRILGLIRGTAINHDGASPGLTVPNPEAQVAVMRRALADAGVDPARVAYVEAHGTGTPTGDPIEMASIGRVYATGRAEGPWVGSVKSNFGHLESAAGIASVIKALLALRHGVLPPNLHFHTPNPAIPWDRYALRVPVRPEPLVGRPLLAAASSFGISGTNAHVILEAPPAPPPVPPGDAELLLPLTARNERDLGAAAARLAEHLRALDPGALPAVADTLQRFRAHRPARLLLRGHGRDALADGLAHWAAGKEAPSVRTARHPPPDPALAEWLRGGPWPVLPVPPPGARGPVSLPGYPFHRRRHWLDPNAHLQREVAASGEGEGVDPLLGSPIVQPGPQRVFARPWRAGTDTGLDGHRVGGWRLMPAALFIALAERAARELLDGAVPELTDLTFGGSPVLEDGQRRVLFTRAEREGEGWRIGVWSRPEGAPEDAWRRHLSVRACAASASATDLAGHLGLSPKQLQRQLGERLDAGAFYAECAAAGFAYAGPHRAVTALHRGPGQALARVEPVGEGPDAYRAVGLLDACFQTCLGVYGQQGQPDGHAYVTLSVRRAFPWRPVGGPLWAWFRLRRAEGDVLEGDLHVVDAGGDLVALFEGCLAQRLPLDRVRAVDEAGTAVEDGEALAVMTEERFYAGLPADRPADWPGLVTPRVGTVVGAALAMPEGEWPDPDLPLRDAGFDSLVGARFVGALERASGLSLPTTLYLEHPTVAGVAAFLAGQPGFAERVRRHAAGG
jgi:acyl transferase domain-containing protein